MPVVEFVGQSARDRDNIAANPSRLVNCYREPIVPGGRTGYSIKSVLGGAPFASVSGVFVRDMEALEDRIWLVCNGRLSEIAADGTVTERGAVDDGQNVTIGANNGDITVTSGGKYYLWDGATLSEPTAGAFSAFGSLEYIGGYTVLTELDGPRFQWSDLLDATSLPGLNFSTADGREGNLTRAMQINGALYLFKPESHEVWYPTGAAGAEAFERMAGGVYDVGLKAFGLIGRFDGGAFMVSDDGRAMIVSNGLQPVSTPPVETAIAQCGPQRVFVYEDEGHTFCVITFANCPAWVYDIATGEWHERAEGDAVTPWAAVTAARLRGVWYVARAGGEIERMSRVNLDAGGPLIRKMVSRPLYMDGERFSLREMELFLRQGDAAGSVMLRLSRDNGRTWGPPRVKSWAVGDYDKRLNWRALGQFRQAVAEVTISDAIDCSVNANARVRL